MKRAIYISILVLTLLPYKVKADNWDIPAVEAYIDDHKTQRSLLLARSTLEWSNDLLHSYSSEQVVDYKKINVELDKYTRAFDVLDVLYQSLATVLNATNTFSSVYSRIDDYRDLLTLYTNEFMKKGRMAMSDTIIIVISEKAIEYIAADCQELYSSFYDLILYVTGVAESSTADLMVILERINVSLDNIEKHLNESYIQSWRYMQLRLGYWKEKVYRAKTKKQMCDEAFGRWRAAGTLE